jgi:hypothetical protein
VQVKSAHRAGEDADEIDALVAYCVPENVWYVFPVSFFSVRRSMNLFPASRRKQSKCEKYREAWWILRGGWERIDLLVEGRAKINVNGGGQKGPPYIAWSDVGKRKVPRLRSE